MTVSPVPSEFGDDQYESKDTPLTCQQDSANTKQGGYDYVGIICSPTLFY
jgi:hypothetical protein